jgi:hypothetical protein
MEPELAAAPLDIQERLDRTVRHETIAQYPVQVEHRLATLVEQGVMEEDRDIVFAVRQTQAGAVAAIQRTEQVVAAEPRAVLAL